MKTLEVTKLLITPLTPIHIGCGMDFEPTNYVIDEDVLFYFDPAHALLNDKDRTALMNALGKGGSDALQRIQKFFYDRRQIYAGVATSCVPVAKGVAALYSDRIGQIAQYEANGRHVSNKLEIERTAHHPHTGEPYLPGSSIKGSMRTAWLNSLNLGRGKPGEEKAQDVEKRLLNGSFHTDPFRLVRLADAAGQGAASKVYFSTNHKKRLVHNKDGLLINAKGPSTRRESIVAGQYRAFASEIRFELLPGLSASDKVPKLDRRINGFKDLAQACNRYYLPRLQRECRLLDERHFTDSNWLSAFNNLLQEIMPQLDSGQLMLLRVGRHSGAESVTLDGIRSIKIMTGKNMAPEYSPEGAKTLWLAAEQESERSKLLPFGWLLIEPADSPEQNSLKAWCEAQPKPDLAAVQARLAEARAAATAESERQKKIAIERAEAKATHDRAIAEKAARIAKLTPNQQIIEAFISNFAEHSERMRGGKEGPNRALHAEARRLAKLALEGNDWTAEEKKSAADAIEEWLPKLVVIDMKDERKKLKLSTLRGNV